VSDEDSSVAIGRHATLSIDRRRSRNLLTYRGQQDACETPADREAETVDSPRQKFSKDGHAFLPHDVSRLIRRNYHTSSRDRLLAATAHNCAPDEMLTNEVGLESGENTSHRGLKLRSLRFPECVERFSLGCVLEERDHMRGAHAHADRNDTLLDQQGELLPDQAIELTAEASPEEIEAPSRKKPRDEMDTVLELVLSCVICAGLWLLMIAVWAV
jgi:hypothetical protein